MPKFYMIFARNARILHNNCQKNIFPIFFFWGGGHVPSCPCFLRGYAYVYISLNNSSIMLYFFHATFIEDAAQFLGSHGTDRFFAAVVLLSTLTLAFVCMVFKFISERGCI